MNALYAFGVVFVLWMVVCLVSPKTAKPVVESKEFGEAANQAIDLTGGTR